jgi:hypothetical protein
MIELTPSAQSRLNDYFQELRRVLSGSPAVDPTDVERDVRDHIDAALVGQAAPVETPALDDVLHKLGSPAQWLPDADATPRTVPSFEWLSLMKQSLRQIGLRLARGPESYRMAYLSFLVFFAGGYLSFLAKAGQPLVLAIPVSFILSRAALSLFTAERLTGGQKWLLYPSLVVVYLPLVVAIVIAPLLARVELTERGSLTDVEVNLAFFALLSFVWSLIGLVSAIFPGAIRSVFYPFAEWFSRRIGVGLAIVGSIGLLFAGTFLLTSVPYNFTHGPFNRPPNVRRTKLTKTAVQPRVEVQDVPVRDDRFSD